MFGVTQKKGILTYLDGVVPDQFAHAYVRMRDASHIIELINNMTHYRSAIQAYAESAAADKHSQLRTLVLSYTVR